VKDGGQIGSSLNGQHVIVCETANSSVSIEAGAQPSVLTFNVPTWVQGSAPSECTTQNTKINYLTYACTVSGGGLSGAARLVKQGDGTLTLPKADFTHTGATDVWDGVLNFDGTMKQSPLWLNRFAQLNSTGGEFLSIKADYGAIIRPGADDVKATMTVGELSLGFGSRLVVDLFGADLSSDCLKVKTLKIERKKSNAWINAGPEYLMPVIEIVGHLADGVADMPPGKYVIAEVEQLEGDINDLLLEGMATTKKILTYEDGKLIIEVVGLRDADTVTWSGANGNSWDYADTKNFMIGDEQTVFVSGDNVTFNDDAKLQNITLNGDLYPGVITIEGGNSFTFGGTGSWCGDASFVHQGTGMVTINNKNTYTGGNHLKGGTTRVSLLANQYSAVGNLLIYTPVVSFA
jgi:autotransporter-associated beta strand protein